MGSTPPDGVDIDVPDVFAHDFCRIYGPFQ